jgi:hypothetical protein
MGLPFYWTITAVQGPANVMSGKNFYARPGSAVTDLRVIITNRVGQLMATAVDETNQPFTTGSVLLMPPDPTELDALGWGFQAAQQNYGIRGVSYYRMERILPGSYLVAAIDVEPYRLSGDAELMERARAAATRIEIGDGVNRAHLRVIRLKPFVYDAPNR